MKKLGAFFLKSRGVGKDLGGWLQDGGKLVILVFGRLGGDYRSKTTRHEGLNPGKKRGSHFTLKARAQGPNLTWWSASERHKASLGKQKSVDRLTGCIGNLEGKRGRGACCPQLSPRW